jgi:hypothetical protein
MTSIQNKYRTSLRSVVILPTNCLARSGLGQRAPLNWFGDTVSLMASLTPVSFEVRRRRFAFIEWSPRWTRQRRCPRLADQAPTWASARTLAISWGLKQLADRLAEKA